MGLCITAIDPQTHQEFNDFMISYKHFHDLRVSLAQLVGAKYYYEHYFTRKENPVLAGLPDRDSYTLMTPDEWENTQTGKAFLAFFLHSDCDGKMTAEEIHNFAEGLKENNVKDKLKSLKDQQLSKKLNDFIDFTNQSAEKHAYWAFY